MRSTVLVAFVFAGLSACSMEEDIVSSDEASVTGETIFYEPFTMTTPGLIDGQQGWIGNCVVEGAPDPYLKCPSGSSAFKYFDRQRDGDFYFRIQVWPNPNVSTGTHTKVFLQGREGRLFNMVVGNESISIGPGLQPGPVLVTIPANRPEDQRYWVECRWSSSEGILRCGGERWPLTITNFSAMALQQPVRSVEYFGIQANPGNAGSVKIDKVYFEK